MIKPQAPPRVLLPFLIVRWGKLLKKIGRHIPFEVNKIRCTRLWSYFCETHDCTPSERKRDKRCFGPVKAAILGLRIIRGRAVRSPGVLYGYASPDAYIFSSLKPPAAVLRLSELFVVQSELEAQLALLNLNKGVFKRNRLFKSVAQVRFCAYSFLPIQ